MTCRATGVTPSATSDPRAGPGVLHKYAGRALLVTTGACAINCRYCFRRHFPYEDENASRGGFAAALATLRGDPSITEVILSGGDPLTLADRRLGALCDELQAIPHLRRVRLHTRLPIVLPERIDADFLELWSAVRLQKVVVVHANHADEIDANVRAALARLAKTGSTLLNQSVLLRGINDEAAVLTALQRGAVRCWRAAVLPASARPRGRRGPFRGPRARGPHAMVGDLGPAARVPGAAARP